MSISAMAKSGTMLRTSSSTQPDCMPEDKQNLIFCLPTHCSGDVSLGKLNTYEKDHFECCHASGNVFLPG